MRCLTERYKSISVDKKRFAGDIFDDIHVQLENSCSHYQIKSSRNDTLQFNISKFLNKSSDIRIDLLFDSYLSSSDNNDLYFLCATWLPPSNSEFLIEVKPIASVVNTSSACFQLDAAVIWPENEEPVWEPLAQRNYNRAEFVEFCKAFTIELALPISSESLKEPSAIEQALISLVKNKVGIGSYPNHEREPLDFSALAISLANLARTQNATHTPSSIESELSLRTDFGRISQNFPINFETFVDRGHFEKSLIERIRTHQHQIVMGKPGAGKSWSLTKLANILTSQGICVAKHYCYLEPGDEELEKRISTDSLFANLLYDLNSQIPTLREQLSSRYSSTLDSLHEAIQKGSEYTDTIVLIIDGLDHISRILSESNQLSLTDTDVIGQLCSLSLPKNVVLIVGSQPGEHLDVISKAFEARIKVNEVPDWTSAETEALLDAHGIEQFCKNSLDLSLPYITDVILKKSEGNPLYATFLARDLINTVNVRSQLELDDWIINKPQLSGNVASYYNYLLSDLDNGKMLIANVLGVIDFGITIDELKQAIPLLSGVIEDSIKHLSPILTEVTAQGGLRIYHESFRRFVVENNLNSAPLTSILEPIVQWLTALNFYESAKSYRFLLVLLRRQKQASRILELVSTDFISKSVEHGHPRIAIEKNIDIALAVASQAQSWSSLAKYSELKRSLHTCFEEKLHDQFDYWETFNQVFGADLTSDRLLFDGKPTLPKRLGVAVCSLINDTGKVAPWREYLKEVEEEKNDRVYMSSNDKPHYDDNFEYSLNRFKGLISTKGKVIGYSRFIKYFSKQTKPINESDKYELLQALQPYFIPEINLRITKLFASKGCVNAKSVVATANLCYAQRANLEEQNKYASFALKELTNFKLINKCFTLGADPKNCSLRLRKPADIPLHIGGHSSEYSDIFEWFLSLHINPDCFEQETARVREGDNWYSQWLKFLLLLAKYRLSPDSVELVDIYRLISINTEPFKGQPRACDLSGVRDLIIDSIIGGLQLTSTEQELADCLHCVKVAMEETGTSMQRSDFGPIQTIPLLRQLCSISDLTHAEQPILSFCKEIVENTESYGTYFESHAEIGMSLAYLFSAFGHDHEAKIEWGKIAKYLCAYGWRKDVTIYEILESLPDIAKDDWLNGKQAFAKSLPLAQALNRHTDGRETRHATNTWFSSLCNSNINVALEVLSTTIHDYDGGVSWILDSATQTLLTEYFQNNVNPTAYHIFSTIDFDFRYEGDAKERINQELQIITKIINENRLLGEQYFNRLVQRYFNSKAKFTDEVIPLFDEFSTKQNIAFTNRRKSKDKDRKPSYNADKKGDQCIRQKLTPKIFLPLNKDYSAINTSSLRRLINYVTDKMDSSGSYNLDSFTNLFGYALCEYAASTDEYQAGEFLILFVENAYIPHIADHHPIVDLAQGFSRLNKPQLACIAYAMSYVFRRGNGGWGNIGDKHAAHYLRLAIEHDKDLALKIFAKGIAHQISNNSYNYGITRAIICRLSNLGLKQEASDAWWAAYEVIKHRLPLTDEDQYCWLNSDPVIKPQGWAHEEGIIALLLGKLDSPYIAKKHDALVAIKNLIKTDDINLISPLCWYLTESTLITSATAMMAMLIRYETAPFLISNGIKDVLKLYSNSPLWIVKYSARTLLKRLHVTNHQPGRTIDIENKSLEARYARELLSMDKSGKAFFLGTIWRDFHQSFCDTLSYRLTSNDFNKEQWHERSKLVHGERGDCYPGVEVLGWEEELAELTTNEVINNLEINAREFSDESEASEFATSILPAVDLYIGYRELKCVRESYPLPVDLDSFSKNYEVDTLLSEDKYNGWIRAAYMEQQWLFGPESYSKEANEKITVHSGIALEPDNYPAPDDAFPLFRTDDISWETSEIDNPKLPQGLSFGLDDYTTWLGELNVLVPHSSLLAALGLEIAPSNPFIAQDNSGNDVLVLRNWQKIYEDSYDTDVIELEGVEVLMHPDLMNRIKSMTECKVIQLTRTTREEVINPVKNR